MIIVMQANETTASKREQLKAYWFQAASKTVTADQVRLWRERERTGR